MKTVPRWHSFVVWNAINCLLLVLIIAHKSATPEVFGRYARSYIIGIALAFILVVLVFLASFLGRDQVSSLLARVPTSWGMVAAFGLLAVVTAIWIAPFDARLIKVLITFNIACFGVWMVFVSTNRTSERSLRYWQLFLLGAFIAVLVIGFFSAHNAPELLGNGDEAAWTNYAVSWLQTGNIYYRMVLKPALPITPGVGYWLVVYALWLKVFGISFASGRLFIWAFYALGAIAIMAVGWRLYDRWVGLIAGLCTAASSIVLQSRIIRPEIGLPIFGALALLLYLRKRSLSSFFAGWLVVLSLEVHAAGLAYIAAAGGLYFTDLLLLRDDPKRLHRLVFFAIGGLIGSGVYILLHILILPEPGYFFRNLVSDRSFLSGFSASNLVRILEILWSDAPVEVIFIAIGFVGLVIRRLPGDGVLLRYWIFCMIGAILLVPDPDKYLILFAPFIFLSIAAFIRYGLDRTVSAPQFVGSTIVILCLSAPFLAQALPALAPNVLSGSEMPPLVRHVRELAGSTPVVGDINTYWWFYNQTFYANMAEYEYGPNTTVWDQSAFLDSPNIVFFTPKPDMPDIPAKLENWLQSAHYVPMDSFENNGVATLIWRRPGYNPQTSTSP